MEAEHVTCELYRYRRKRWLWRPGPGYAASTAGSVCAADERRGAARRVRRPHFVAWSDCTQKSRCIETVKVATCCKVVI
jgi:hypothetical protein